jgi:iron complex transport system ATP-binding protein
MDTLLKTSNLCGGYSSDIVIKNVSLEIKKGDFLGIIGPNGSGKSTLLRLMTKAMPPREGEITFEDERLSCIPLKEFCRKVAFVPQDTMINFSFSVWEIVLMGRIPHLGRLEFETQKDFSAGRQALSLTDALHLKERQVDELSAGERQRVVIARALTQEPRLLFLDEPTAHLDIGHQIQILDLLKRLNQRHGLAIVVVLHDLNLAGEYCKRIILLNEGEIFKEGTPDEVLTYQNIEEVYKTIVLVNRNPVSSKPYIVLVSKER